MIAASNYCRDPDNAGFAWCYTMNISLRWDECDENLCRRTTGQHSDKHIKLHINDTYIIITRT